MENIRVWRLKGAYYRLEGSNCPECKILHFPARRICPDCGFDSNQNINLNRSQIPVENGSGLNRVNRQISGN